MVTKERLIRFETAKLLEEIGFINPNTNTLHEAHQWLIEEHGIYIVVIPTITSDWTFKSIRVLYKLDKEVIMGIKSVYDLPPYKEVSGEDFSTNLDALEAGIFEGLKQVKEKNEK